MSQSPHCSFCGKDRGQVQRLIEGADGVYICDECVLLGAEMVGFGGLEDVRFRDPVLPGDRMYLLCKLDKVRRGRMIICRFQGVVNDNVCVEGVLKGIPIPVAALRNLKRG